jgi:hypothetical protein
VPIVRSARSQNTCRHTGFGPHVGKRLMEAMRCESIKAGDVLKTARRTASISRLLLAPLDKLFSRHRYGSRGANRSLLRECLTMFTMFHVKRVHDHPRLSTIIYDRSRSSTIIYDHPRSSMIVQVVHLN